MIQQEQGREGGGASILRTQASRDAEHRLNKTATRGDGDTCTYSSQHTDTKPEQRERQRGGGRGGRAHRFAATLWSSRGTGGTVSLPYIASTRFTNFARIAALFSPSRKL